MARRRQLAALTVTNRAAALKLALAYGRSNGQPDGACYAIADAYNVAYYRVYRVAARRYGHEQASAATKAAIAEVAQLLMGA